MKYIIIVSLLLVSLVFTRQTIAEDRIDFSKFDYTISVILVDKMVAKYATGTKAYQIKRTIYCESGFRNIQSFIKKDGVREESYGIAQIHLPSHPSVSKSQALNPEFAIEFMSNNWNKVKWYGYNRNTDTCN